MGLHQECVMLPCMFHLFTDGMVMEANVKVLMSEVGLQSAKGWVPVMCIRCCLL